MRKLKMVSHQEVCELICDGCGLQACVDEGYEFGEFISIERRCGYGAIHGDGKRLSIDLCQHCFADMCGDTLRVTDPLDNQSTDSSEDALEYKNIFQALSQSKQKAIELKQESEIRISARDILFVNSISNQEELQIALKRVEQLWDAQFQSAEGNELHKLADLICAYEYKSWDSYFAQRPLADDDFMSERLSSIEDLLIEEGRVVSGILADTRVDKDIDDDPH